MYAFVSPDKPDTVTLIANYVPLEDPDGGPNFYEFGDDVLYEIHIDNNGAAGRTSPTSSGSPPRSPNPNTFLYNTGPIKSLDSPNWNRRQFYTVTRVDSSHGQQAARHRPALPAVQHRPASTPNYAALAAQAVHQPPRGRPGVRRAAG